MFEHFLKGFLPTWLRVLSITSGMVNWLTPDSLPSCSSNETFPHVLSFLSFVNPTIPSCNNMKFSHSTVFHYLMMMWLHGVQHTPSIAYTEYGIHQVQHTPTSANCDYVSGSLWECLRVVGTQFHGGQIPELNRPILSAPGAPGTIVESQQHAWEHAWQDLEQLGVQRTSLERLSIVSRACRVDVQQSEKTFLRCDQCWWPSMSQLLCIAQRLLKLIDSACIPISVSMYV
jgi:hypothetical protein